MTNIVDGVALNGQHLAVKVEDGEIFIGTPADFAVASFELLAKVKLVKRTYIPIRDWARVHLRLPLLDANG